VDLNGRLLKLSNNYYETLGVARDASAEDIKSAFRKLAKEHHPDAGGEEDKFKELNEAYEVLSDPEKRSQYDNPAPAGGFGFENIFGFNFRQQRQPPRPDAPRRGQDIKLQREIPIHLFVFGGKLKINLTYPDVCQSCAGRGATEFDKCTACGGAGSVTRTENNGGMFIRTVGPCPTCNGRGQTPKNVCGACSGTGNIKVENRELTVEIPAGFRDGDHMIMEGAGRSGIYGGPAGNMILFLTMKYPNPEELTSKQRKVLEQI
jgi:molecular chaperone DnaJ